MICKDVSVQVLFCASQGRRLAETAAIARGSNQHLPQAFPSIFVSWNTATMYPKEQLLLLCISDAVCWAAQKVPS